MPGFRCRVGSPAVASRGYSVVVHGLLIVVTSLVSEHRLQGTGRQQSWLMGLAGTRHVESSWSRDWTRVSCTGRQILYHWAMREACWEIFDYWFSFLTSYRSIQIFCLWCSLWRFCASKNSFIASRLSSFLVYSSQYSLIILFISFFFFKSFSFL